MRILQNIFNQRNDSNFLPKLKTPPRILINDQVITRPSTAKLKQQNIKRITDPKTQLANFAALQLEARNYNLDAANKFIQQETILKQTQLSEAMRYDYWFEAAKLQDVRYIGRYSDKYLKSVSKSSNNYLINRFEGWTALHYCCYLDHLDLFDALFKIENSIVTQSDNYMVCNGIDFEEICLLPRGSNFIQIALLANSQKIIQLVFSSPKYFKAAKQCDFIAEAGLCWRNFLTDNSLVNSELFLTRLQLSTIEGKILHCLQSTNSLGLCYLVKEQLLSISRFQLHLYQQCLEKPIRIDNSQNFCEPAATILFLQLLFQDSVNFAFEHSSDSKWHTLLINFFGQQNVKSLQKLKMNISILKVQMQEDFFEIVGLKESSGKLGDQIAVEHSNECELKEWKEFELLYTQYQMGLL